MAHARRLGLLSSNGDSRAASGTRRPRVAAHDPNGAVLDGPCPDCQGSGRWWFPAIRALGTSATHVTDAQLRVAAVDEQVGLTLSERFFYLADLVPGRSRPSPEVPMPRLSVFVLTALVGFARVAHAAPTPAQLCESAMELASAKYAQCRLNAESKFSKTGDAVKRTDALAKCTDKLTTAFTKAYSKYFGACVATEPSSDFATYLNQCSDDAAAAAAGSSLPDYAGDLAACLGGLPPAPLLKTGQTTSYGAGTDGDLQLGVAHSFVNNGDGTITDTKTGLMWEKKSDDGSIHDKDNTYTWCVDANSDLVCDNGTSPMDGTIATTFLAGLNAGGGFAGHTDWRLPNLTELESIRDLGSRNPATFTAFKNACLPACTVLACSCTVSSWHWSSSSESFFAWFIDFSAGSTSAEWKSNSYHVRAVRGGS